MPRTYNYLNILSMTNTEKYNKVFEDVLELNSDKIKEAKFKDTELWDSVGHMTLVANLEDAFDILFETDDLMSITSYDKGLEILSKNYGIEF